MKTYFLFLHKLLLGTLALTLLFTSCKKNSNDDVTILRLFRPVLNPLITVNNNSINVAWYPIKGTFSYKAEISRDSFLTIDASYLISKDTTTKTFSNLLWATNYFIRVQALGSDTSLNSKTAVFPKTSTINIAYSPGVNDLGDANVIVRWYSGSAPTKLKVEKTDGTLIAELPITAKDLTLNAKEIINLTASTSYKISIFVGDDVRGWAIYKSIPKPQLGNNVIDLRAITGRPTVLTDTLALAPSGSTIIAKRGEIYNCFTSSAYTLTKSFTITSLVGLGNTPVLTFFNEIDISGPIDSIKFLNVSINGMKDTVAKTKISYLINTTSGFTSVLKKLNFENSSVSMFNNAVVRLQSSTPTTVSAVLVNNCIVNDIGNSGSYAVFHSATTGNVFTSITVQNSTFYNLGVGLIFHSSANATKATISNCTFNDVLGEAADASGTTRTLVDYGTNIITTCTFNNCIIGATKTVGASLKGGIKANSASSITTTNSFQTSDCKITASVISGIGSYNSASTALFKSPATGDFTIIDGTFTGKTTAGDLRWKP